MSDGSDISVQNLVRQVEVSGDLNGTDLEVWTGGGQPPPYYRSDQFRLLTAEGRSVLQFARPKWDKNFNPPDLIEKFQLPADKEDIKRIFRLLRESDIFANHYVEELDPRIGDVLKTEVILRAGGKTWERTYYRQLPAALAPLKKSVDRYIENLLEKGEHTLFHQGKQVPIPSGDCARSKA